MGKGQAQLGKPVKGKSKSRKSQQRAPNQVSDAQLNEDIKRLEEYERLNRMAERQRQILKRLHQQEQVNSRLNKQLILNIHRNFLRADKLDSLRKDIQIAAQNHQRDVDRKDAMISSLARDLDSIEQQLQHAQRTHSKAIDELVTLHESKVSMVVAEFERDLKTLKQEFNTEREYIIDEHKRDEKEMEAVLKAIQAEDQTRKEDVRQAHNTNVQTIKNRHDSQLSELRRTLETQIAELEKQFDHLHKSYKHTADSANQNFKKNEQQDQERQQYIKWQCAMIDKYQRQLTQWRKVIDANAAECVARNQALKQQRDVVIAHCSDLKARMKRFRGQEQKRLTELTVLSRDALKSNQERLTAAQRVLQLAELARKLETERERVVPFYPSTPLPPHLLHQVQLRTAEEKEREKQQRQELSGDKQSTNKLSLSSDLSDEAKQQQQQQQAQQQLEELQQSMSQSLQPIALNLDGSPVGEWNYLDNFFKKYNKVLLDKLAIDQEKKRLQKENEDLRVLLKQYLDGISVTQDVVDQDNPLLIVNGRLNLVEKLPVRRGRPNVTQEAVQIVHNYAVQAKR